MIGHPETRRRLAERASEIVRTRFSFDAGVEWIAGALGGESRLRSGAEARAAE